MSQVEREFTAILEPPPEAREAPPLTDLVQRIGSLTAVHAVKEKARVDRIRAASSALEALKESGLNQIHNQYLGGLPGLGSTYSTGFGFHTLCRPHTPPQGTIFADGWASVVVGGNPRMELLLAAVGVELTDKDLVRLTAGYGLVNLPGTPSPDVIWLEQRMALLDSAEQAAAISELGQGLIDNAVSALARLAERLASDNG